MLLAAIYSTRNATEEGQRRSLELFMNWQPPFEFQAHYARADGRGGIGIFDVDDPAVVLEAVTPFTAFFDFEVVPLVDIQDAVPIFSKSNEWVASVV